MSHEREITWEEFEKEFRPIANHLNPDASWGGLMFETFGPELEFVLAQDPCKIWTWVETDDQDDEDLDNQKFYVASGLHYVNRMGYFITEAAFPEDACITAIDD